MDARQRWHHVHALLSGVAELVQVLKEDGHLPSSEQVDAIGKLLETIKDVANDKPNDFQ